ncbi:hypothetical protein Sps_02881 [Shewanella psychrophila]|uniref:Uncharacterized protein n=1 Tax=Shewanella psychrophila TaxID=225848 RepID=A0A1S6HR77_9GAMM|nr:hypothetical protein [Shewanella psychrophila]AQS38029.1 hypothetical protein Sps_02881 [Shewanella psychrophila]
MKFKTMYFSLFMFMSNLSYSADRIEKNIFLYAHINNEEFYSYSVTKFGFKQPSLDIEYNQSVEKFISKSTTVFIKTDIPVGFSAGFEITPTVLESSCVDVDGSIDVEGFATYYMDGQALQIEKPIVFDYFNNSNSQFLSDTREFSIEFSPTPGLDVWKSRCKGSATLYVALSF